MNLKSVRRIAGVLGVVAAGVMAGCGSGGIAFNGDGEVQRILPRTLPLLHFPLPCESFDVVDQLWQLDSDVQLNGRDTKSPPGEAAPYYDWAEPVTEAMADYLWPELFQPRDDTDVWFTQGTGNRDPQPSPIDEGQYLGDERVRGAAMSYVAQWLMQTVDGQVRTDSPLLYDTQEYESIAISQDADEDPNTTPPHDSTILATSNVSETQLPNPVDPRIALFDHLQEGDVIETGNINALYTPVTMPGTCNDIEWAAGYYCPSSVLFGKYMEVKQENLFIECNGVGTLTEAPTNAYFTPSGRLSLPGGIYVDRLLQGFEISYPNALQSSITGVYATGYYAGGIQGHIIGVGVGVPQVAFVRPGVNNGEEDIMNVNIETDQVYYCYGNRRLQYTSDSLLIMQNVQNFPLTPEDDGSFPRADALALALNPTNTEGHLNLACIFMGETTPGPNRYAP